MTVELLNTLSLVSYIVAGVLLLLSVALFFLLDVPKLYGEITGKTAKKAIDAIQKHNESSKANGYDSNKHSRSKLTDKISKSGRITSYGDGGSIGVSTEKIAVNQNPNVSKETTVLSQSNETTVLSDSNETTVLSIGNNETTVLSSQPTSVNETTVLVNENPVMGETTVLTQDVSYVDTTPAIGFELEAEFDFAESSEIIE